MAPVLPGSTLGILGGGQLGRMLAIEARRFGYRVVVFTDVSASPAGEVANEEIVGTWDDEEALDRFSSHCDVVTYEFENIPFPTLERVATETTARPSGALLHTTQHRLREKRFLREHELPTTEFAEASSAREISDAVESLGPSIVKTAAWGYDGKGQSRIESPEEAPAVWEKLGTKELIVEKLVEFDFELSVVVARGALGEAVCYSVTRNDHSNGILDLSTAPAEIPEELASRAQAIAVRVAGCFELQGLLCVEMFAVGDELLINEIAPRPHNSGHWTIDAAVTSQFEQQLRAVCGLPLGDVTCQAPVAMANLLGDLWTGGDPDWNALLALPGVKLHLYGKREPRPGRKMGHLTTTGENVEEAKQRVVAARALLQRSGLGTRG